MKKYKNGAITNEILEKLQQKRLEIRREYQNKPNLNYHAYMDEYPREKLLLQANDLIIGMAGDSNLFENQMKVLEDKWKFSDYVTYKS